MNGDIRVKSRPGRGSDFIVAFPVRVSEEVSAVTASGGGAEDHIQGVEALRGKKYLLLDDVAENTFILSELLKRYGILCTTKQNGVEALELFKEDPAAFDGVITDLRMPLMSGQSFIQDVRSFERDQPNGRRVPIVIMTAESAMEERRLCLAQYGADEFLLKPVKLRDLISSLVRVHSVDKMCKQKHILIVDDDVIGSRFMAAALTKERHKCSHAGSVTEGIALIRRARYDLVVLDNLLGDGTGADFLKQANEVLSGASSTKVISVSGNSAEEQRRMYQEGGAGRVVAYLQKPVRKQELLGLIQVI